MPAESHFLAFDVGGTRLKAGVVNGDTAEVEGMVTAPVGKTIDAALQAVGSVGADLMQRQTCDAVGLCYPGIIDENGVVLSLPGKLAGSDGYDIAGFLRSRFRLEATVVNDAIAYGAGEAGAGAGAGFSRVVVITIGTGVGVTVFENGAPVTAGPLGGGILGGQIPIAEGSGPWRDTSGRAGTIEALCRAERLVDYARDAGSSADTVETVYARAAADEGAARQAVAQYSTHLAQALVALAHAHAPDIIVLGGGPMVPGNPVLPGVEDVVNGRLFGSYRTRLALARLGDSAALIGLAQLHRATVRT